MKPGVLVLTLVMGRLVVAQGFGGSLPSTTRRVTLERVLPAVVDLTNRKVSVVVRRPGRPGGTPGEAAGADPVAALLQAKLATVVQSVPGAVLEEQDAALEVELAVTEYEVTRESRSQNGRTCTYYVGHLEGAYRATDRGTGRPLDAMNLTQAQTAPPCSDSGLGSTRIPTLGGLKRMPNSDNQSEAGTRDHLVDGIVAQVARRISRTDERIEVPLPRGSLNDISNLAASGLWMRTLEDAESRTPLPKPEDDAYRLYLAGLANEALAYQNVKNPAIAHSFLEAAAKRYEAAAAANPSEKEFVNALERVREANAVVIEQKLAAPAPEDRKSTPLPTSSGSSAPSPLQTVLDLCNNHVPNIVQLIHEEPAKFPFQKPLTLTELISIQRDCGSQASEITAAIRSRTSASPATKKQY